MSDQQHQSPDSLEHFFDNRASHYDEIIKNNNYYIPNWVEEHAIDLEGKRILDLACGTGNLGALIVDSVDNVELVGVDLSNEMLKEATARQIYTRLIHHDLATGLPESILSERYDLILAFGFLEFLDDPSALLSEMSLLLNNGAKIWTSIEKSSSDSVTSGVVRPELGFAMFHYSEFDARAIIEKANLTINSLDEIGSYNRSYDDVRVPWFIIVADVPE